MTVVDELAGLRRAAEGHLRLLEEREQPEERSPRRELRRLGVDRLLPAVPGLVEAFKTKVPDEFYALEDKAAVISCPCGEDPTVPERQIFECECGRFFLWTGHSVRVYRPPGVD